MAMTAKTRAKNAAARQTSRSGRNASGGGADAITLLEHDHREVEDLFDDYAKLIQDKQKADLAEKICLSLKVHMQIEEEIFYPQARKATEDDDLLNEAIVEHAGAKHLISEIEEMDVDEELYDAKIQVLSEQIKHHVEDEEKELFPEIKKTELDLDALGKKLAARKEELMSELASA